MGFIAPIAVAMGASASTAATISTIGSVVAAAGTAASFLGTMQQAGGQEASAQAAANASRYNAEVSRNNAQIAKQNAAWAAQEGSNKVAQDQMKTRAEIAALTASQGSSGVRLDSPSFVDVRSSAKEQGELSALDIRTKTARQAYGYDVEESNYLAQAGLDDMSGKSSKEAGKIQSSATILGGFGDAGMNYGKYLEAGSVL